MVGGAVQGPDGGRNVDITVHAAIDGVPKTLIIGVVDFPQGKRAGVNTVDAADSMRRDIQADFTIICSNTGFEPIAIRKAKRKQIGLISVLHQGDPRVKAVIEEVMYLRRWDLNPFTFSYHGEPDRLPNVKLHDIKYHGESVDAWLIWRAIMIAFSNPTIERKLIASFNLKNATEFYVGQKRIKLDSFSIRFHPHVKWFSQTVRLDATTGIYDYLRGKVRLAGGTNSYIIQGIDFDKATPLSSPPEIDDLVGGLLPGEIDIRLLMFDKLPDGVGNYSPTLEAIVRPEDLTTRIGSTD